MTEKQERIVCSAIWNPSEVDMGGHPLIYCGLRHAYILWQGKHVSRNPKHQGFLTSTGRWVGREEALQMALNTNQILDITQIRGDRLFSEDLY